MHYFKTNLPLLLAAILLILFAITPKQANEVVNELTNIEFVDLVSKDQVSKISISRDSMNSLFTNIVGELKNSKKVKTTSMNSDSLINYISNVQMQNGKTLNDMIPVSFTSNTEDNSANNSFIMFVAGIALIFYFRKGLKNANNIKNSSSNSKSDSSNPFNFLNNMNFLFHN